MKSPPPVPFDNYVSFQAYETYGARPVTRTNVKNVTFYVMSSNDEAGIAAGQYWTSLEQFPTPKMTKYYMHGDRTVSTNKPSKDDGQMLSTSFKFDPADPVPTVGGSNLFLECGPLDQSEIDKRSDVLVFETATFDEELPLTGPLNAFLYVSSDVIDTDVVVCLSL